MKEIIKLSDCPDNLQQAVSAYLIKFPEVEVLSVQRWIQTPYKDKSITSTYFKVFTLHGNYFCVYKTSVCSKPEWTDEHVSESCMIAGEIAEIVELSPEWFRR